MKISPILLKDGYKTDVLTLKDECTWAEEAEGELKTVFKDGNFLAIVVL